MKPIFHGRVIPVGEGWGVGGRGREGEVAMEGGGYGVAMEGGGYGVAMEGGGYGVAMEGGGFGQEIQRWNPFSTTESYQSFQT